MVDTFLSDLRRLARLADIESDKVICRAFICGLPSDVSSSLRADTRIAEKSLMDIVAKARILMDERTQGAMVAIEKSNLRFSRTASNNAQKTFECFLCGGNHLARQCKLKRKIVCWKCNEQGHVERNCPQSQRLPGNGNGELQAPAVSPKV